MSDVITTEIIRHGLLAAADEMATNLCRTAYNTMVYEVHDYCIGIHDVHGDVLADTPGIAMLTGSNDRGIRESVAFLGSEQVRPGDVYFVNYPYWAGGHTLDPIVFAPIHHDGQLLGYASCRIHVLDLNQKDVGYVLDSTHISQEGLVLPASRLYAGGELNNDVFNIIRFNSRFPARTIGDIQAQVSACLTGVRRVNELAERYGRATLLEAMRAILDHGERLARIALARLPKGSWTAHDFVDSDGVDLDRMIRLEVTVSIDDDGMTLDWRGSDRDVRGPANLPLGQTEAMCFLVFKALTTPDTPVNAGNFRPLTIITEPGSVLHAVPPMPTFTTMPSFYGGEVVLKALAQGMPELVPACSGGDVCTMMGVGLDPRTGLEWNESSNEAVGFGGHVHGDGADGIMTYCQPGARNNPVEVLETKAPLLIEHYGYRTDSGGPGLNRGGVGVERRYRFLAPATGICLTYKTKTKPWPIGGGKQGGHNHVVLHPGTEREAETGGGAYPMAADDVLVNKTGGGGGYGNPRRRDPARVATDVRNGFVSPEAACRDYAVVLDPQTGKVDAEATAELRGVLA